MENHLHHSAAAKSPVDNGRVEPASIPSNQMAPCIRCDHNENAHVPFPVCGDLGWYGCIECDNIGVERCRFFGAAT